jgi:tetratricopeptide (TPR) repeat protein
VLLNKTSHPILEPKNLALGHFIQIIVLSFFLLPHGDLHQRILELTEAIHQHPERTKLYLERGELNILHEDFPAARLDFYVCIQHGLMNGRVSLGLSKTLYHVGLSDSSLYYVDLALTYDAHHPSALEWRAFVLQDLDRFCESAQVYESLISLTPQPTPSLFIDASRAWKDCDEMDAEDQSIHALHQGLLHLGQIHVIEKELVSAYLRYGKYEEALNVQTNIIEHWASKIKPYYERAEIYLLMQKKELAHEDLRKALLEIETLPAHKSSTQAMRDMRNKIISKLNQPAN